MKINYFTILSIILINSLCILSNPINDNSLNNENNNNRSFIKRGIITDFVCLIKGPKYQDQWLFCKFDCMKEPASACQRACNMSKTCSNNHNGFGAQLCCVN